jgi:hypothetical protein
MNDQMIIAALGFLGALIVVMAPVIRLNGHITELTVLFRELKALVEEKTDSLDRRVTEHGKQIDELKVTQAKHEERLKQLEK